MTILQDNLKKMTGLTWVARGMGGNTRALVARVGEYEILATDGDYHLPKASRALIGVYDSFGEPLAEFEGTLDHAAKAMMKWFREPLRWGVRRGFP